MTLTGRIFLAWEVFIVQVKVVGSLSVLSDTRADFLHFPWRSLQNLPELTKCPCRGRLCGGRVYVYP